MDGKVLNIGDDQNVIVQSDLVHPLSPDCEKPPITVQHNGEISSNGMKYTDAIEYGASLTCQDIQRIQLTVNEFISKALLPYMERQCRNLHESVLFSLLTSLATFNLAVIHRPKTRHPQIPFILIF